MITLDKLQKELDFFRKMYDIVRIVDPVRKIVLDYRENLLDSDTATTCYDYWENGKICDNCVSVRAYKDNVSFMKLEHTPCHIMMVMAIPVENTGEPVVLELFKNATDSMLFGSGDYSDGVFWHDFVSNINDMIVRDSMTSLYNRRFIDDRLPVEIVKSVVKDWPISVIMMDIDNLKEINDEHGHLAGDEILKGIGKILGEKFRSEHFWAARYGGNEFLICLANADSDQAFRTAEEIRSSLKQLNVKIRAKDVNPTLSIGIYTAKDSGLTAEEMIELADRQMYIAKKRGKDCIVRTSSMI